MLVKKYDAAYMMNSTKAQHFIEFFVCYVQFVLYPLFKYLERYTVHNIF